MGKLYRGTCNNCRETFAARSPSALLSKMSKHRWKKHESWMKRRITEGKAVSADNPTVQDFIAALQDSPGRAFEVYKTLRERDYMTLKHVMDALEVILPDKVKIAWKAVEAIHDIQKGA